MPCIDLHIHSFYSDGSLSPKDLLKLGRHHGLHAMALTDHDTIEGVAELQQLGQDAGMTIISGVEVSTTYKGHTIHILGYGFNPADQAIHNWLAPLQQERAQRNRRILAKLRELNIQIEHEELAAISKYGQIGRPHIAQLLIQHGVVSNFDEAFRQFLGRGKAAWVPRSTYGTSESIAMLHRIGGKAILAHPAILDPNLRLQTKLIDELVAVGLDGLEAYYPTHTIKFRKQLLQLAEKHHLLITGGSDFHGATRPNNQLAGIQQNFCPPASLLGPLLAAMGMQVPRQITSNRT